MSLSLEMILSGVLLVLALSPLGCFLIWNRMSYLSDTLSHASILGTAIGMLLHIPLSLSNLIFLVVFVILLKVLLDKNDFSRDVVFSLLSYGGVGFGVSLMYILNEQKVVKKVLFGELTTLSTTELGLLAFMALATNLFLLIYHKNILCYILDKNLAKTSGIRVDFIENAFLLMTAFVVGYSIYCVGALIVPALLIIPACAVRPIAKNYKRMIFYSSVYSVIMMIMGLKIVREYDLLLGPALICVYLMMMILLHFLLFIRNKRIRSCLN